MVRQLLRQPTYVVTTLAFPAMFFGFFGVPNAKDPASARMLVASFSAFAIMGVLFFQMSIEIAHERAHGWSQYLKILPVSGVRWFAARMGAALFFASGAVAAIFATAWASVDLQLGPERGWRFALALLGGGACFACLGVAIGYWSSQKAVVPTANLIYLPLSFAGGLWLPPEALPQFVQKFSPYLPTRFYGDLVWSQMAGEAVGLRPVLGLLGYTVIFLIVAMWGIHRDRELRFH
jgi:ABC-2 type transport system permease protein